MENAELKVEYMAVGDLKQYPGNAKRHPKKQVAEIRESIEQFGFNDPIAIWRNNEIIEGHGRLLAALEMGMETVPVIRLDSLTDEERRAYVLAHNQTTLSSGWDEKKLRAEIQNLPTIDMGKFGFNVEALEGLDEGWYGDERERTNDAYNLGIAQETEFTEDFWQMPVIRKTDHYPETLIGFNYAKTSEEKYAGIHFFVDDYQFERVWNYPEKYVDILLPYDCILSPDFSLYLDMPMPMKIWNVYRSRQIGAFYQDRGIIVIPTLSWAEPDTYQFCFRGIEKGSVVAVSTVGVKESKESLSVYFDGMAEAIRQIEPSVVLEYGGDVGFDYGGIKVKRYKNQVTENWKNGR